MLELAFRAFCNRFGIWIRSSPSLTLYLGENGNPLSSLVIAPGTGAPPLPSTLTFSSNSFALNRRLDASDSANSGLIANVRMWRSVLSAQQLRIDALSSAAVFTNGLAFAFGALRLHSVRF